MSRRRRSTRDSSISAFPRNSRTRARYPRTCLISEELNYGCAGITNSIAANDLATLPLLIAGNEEQKTTYLGALMKKLTFCAFAITEPGAGSDRCGHEHHLSARGRRVHHQRHQAFYFERLGGGLVCDLRTSDKRLKHKAISCFVFPATTPASQSPDAWQAGSTRGRHRRDFFTKMCESPRVRWSVARARASSMRDGDL